MKKTILLSFAALALSSFSSKAQDTGPYVIKASDDFTSPKRHKVTEPVGYGKDGIIQVNAKGCESFSFQSFSNDLKFQKENTVNTEALLNENTSYNRFVKLKNKTYLFVRDVNKTAKTEGISALEFSQKDLTFVGKSKNLFQSSDKVRMVSMGFMFGMSAAPAPSADGLGSASDYGYNFVLSNDRSKFLYTYSLSPKEKKDALNNDVIGMYVYDENLVKQWGDEFEMPYTEAKMDNLGYTVGNDSKVYLLAKVYESTRPKESKDKDKKLPNYHFEVMVYDKSTKKPKIIQLKLDSNFPKEAYIYEDANHNIVVAGFYGKSVYKPVDGAYLVKLDIENGVASKINGGFYEIPSDIIKAFTSDREKRKMEKKEDKDAEGDIGVDNLKIRDIYEMPNGSTKIVSEQYVVRLTYYYDFSCKCMKTRYDTYADDIFVMSIDAKGKLEWVKKIPKAQHAPDGLGDGLSINSLVSGNDVHIFYIDNIKNLDLPSNEAPKVHENRRGGFLTAVTVTEKGDVKKYSLGEIKVFKTNFFIRGFVDGGNNNLISTERRKKKNKLISLEIK